MFDHFGILAPVYDRALPLRHAEQLIAMLQVPVHGVILDVGGGTGRVAQVLQGQASAVVVVDLSHKMLIQAQKKDGLALANTASEQLPFPDDCFERILMVDALHHVVSQRQTASELWRVLQPGGRLVIEEPDIRTLPVKLVALAEKLALMRSHFLSPLEIARLFDDPRARTNYSVQGYIAWVVVEKTRAR